MNTNWTFNYTINKWARRHTQQSQRCSALHFLLRNRKVVLNWFGQSFADEDYLYTDAYSRTSWIASQCSILKTSPELAKQVQLSPGLYSLCLLWKILSLEFSNRKGKLDTTAWRVICLCLALALVGQVRIKDVQWWLPGFRYTIMT